MRIQEKMQDLRDVEKLVINLLCFLTHLNCLYFRMSDDDDDYVAFGKALKPIEEGDTIRKKPIAVEEQIVRDVNGIRRFHGAFTGGFSAGHFNTVNTPQGWYPKQFKSSRETKAERKQQRPEDFMDDEDLGEFGFAAQSLKTKSNFQRGAANDEDEDSLGRSKRVVGVLNTGGYIEQLVKPVSSSLGERLLSRQGWKPGQGIGPKINKENKKSRLASHVRTYGCSGPDQRQDTDQDDDDPFMEKYKDFLFAPDEIPLYVARPKENFFGIGYVGLGQSEEARNAMMNSSRPGGSKKVKGNLKFGSGGSGKKFSISGEAFGIGADEEEDDMEVYNHGDMGQYDFSLDLLGEEKKERREARGSRWSKDEKSSDTHIDGFSAASAKSMIKKHFPSERPPHDWRPRSHPAERQSRFSPALADPALPPARRSRWDISQNSNPSVEERKSKLFPDQVNASKPSTTSSTSAESESKPPTLPEFLQHFKPGADNNGLASFKPFARDSAKQTRYEQYLVCVQNNRRDALPLLQPKTMTDWEKEREKVEFERASMLFKPMKGVIGSRFVSAGASEDTEDSKSLSAEDEAERSLRKAADMKMFGRLTRSTEDWHPARLVCVRFNVPHPYGDYSVVGTKTKARRETGVSNVFAMLESDQAEPKKEADDAGDVKQEEVAEDVKIEVDSVKQEEEEEAVKPPSDLFKAIFLDSDSDNSDSDDDDDDTSVQVEDKSNNKNSSSNISEAPIIKQPPQPQQSKPWEERRENTMRNSEPARGIFANIDLDSLNRRVPAVKKDDVTPAERPVAKGSSKDISVAQQTVRTVLGIRSERAESSSGDEYGPRLPDNMIPASIVISSDSEDERSSKKKKKKEKKKKSKKNKKKISRHRSRSRSRDDYKHKKRKRSYSSSSG